MADVPLLLSAGAAACVGDTLLKEQQRQEQQQQQQQQYNETAHQVSSKGGFAYDAGTRWAALACQSGCNSASVHQWL
jgi:tyrosyl-tRNA synthetase